VDNSIKTEQIAEPVKENIQKQETISSPTGDNEYIVQQKDTLFDISSKLYGDPSKWKALYDRNKDTIEKPSVIFPGQKLKTDINR
jgi:nucleoid-associated protein YgaU